MGQTDRTIHQLAAGQHGVFTRAQAQDQGISRHMLASRIRSGQLRPLDHQVLAVNGSADTAHRRAIAGVLSIDHGAMAFESTAAYWGLPSFALEPIEVLTARPGRRRHPTKLAIAHTTTHLPDEHLTVRDGLRLTIPARTLFDLAGRIHPDRLERTLDTAWRKRLVTGRLLRRTLAELAEHGRPGIQVMRELIMKRGDDYRPTDSNVEARFQQLMAQVGITTLDRQVDLGDVDWLGRVDFRDRQVPMVVEIDSETFHTSLVDQAGDAARRARLEEAGFTIVVVSDFDVWHRAQEVQQRVRCARQSLLPRYLSSKPR